jgi:hypothetical protein
MRVAPEEALGVFNETFSPPVDYDMDALAERATALSSFRFRSGCADAERLGGKFSVLDGVPIALGAAATAVHPTDVRPEPPALGNGARSASTWRGISWPST